MAHPHPPEWDSGELPGEWHPSLTASGTSTDAAVLAAESADAAELASTGQATRVGGLPEAAWPQDLGPTSMGTQTQG